MNSLHANSSQEITLDDAAEAEQGERLLSLLMIARGLEEKVEKSLAEVELSVAKFGVLNHLVLAGQSIPLSELAARVHCVRSNVTQMVDRLAAEGLVRRVTNPADRRIILAQLTEEGRRRHASGEERIHQMEREMAESFPADDRAVVRRAMESLG